MSNYPDVVAKIVSDYLERVKSQLRLVPVREQNEFLREIESHVYEAYQQTPGATFSGAQGYGLNLTGDNLNDGVEIDDIAEFTAATGGTLTGIIDENYDPGNTNPIYDQVLNGTYTGPDASGRYAISATTGTSSSNGTLNGGFGLTYYTVDGTTFPFIETDDSGQVAIGVLIEQNPSGVYSTPDKSQHMFVVRPLIKPRAAQKKAK